jgi:hypothetical protein
VFLDSSDLLLGLQQLNIAGKGKKWDLSPVIHVMVAVGRFSPCKKSTFERNEHFSFC